jgi:hypothetical protein
VELIRAAVALLFLIVVPGTVLWRIPTADRPRRANLPWEERLFWCVALSVIVSTIAGLTLAAGGWYRFERLLWVDVGVASAILIAFRQRLRPGGAAGPSWSALLPASLVAAAALVIFEVPPAEYIMGGKDPGVYMTEGIRIAQRGGIVEADEAVSTLPVAYRDLFFPRSREAGYYSSRFMGYFLLDPASGTVVGQFPDGFPVWVAIGYGIDGLTGARAAPEYLALLGLMAVYFAGARLFGRAAALAGAGLLAVNVAQVWYSRYPSAEILLQPLVFAGLLAYTRAVYDDDRFFAPVAALLFTIGAFTHITGVLVSMTMAVVALFDVLVRRRHTGVAFWMLLAGGCIGAGVFLWRYIPPYFNAPVYYFAIRGAAPIAAAVAAVLGGLAALLLATRLPPVARERWLAWGLTVGVWLLAVYAFFFRHAGGLLASQDADSLRTFTAVYVPPLGLTLALIGLAIAAMSSEASSPFLILLATFSATFFYKIRIIPEHFWAGRRFLAVILPGVMLLIGTAAFGGRWIEAATRRGPLVRAWPGLLQAAVGVVLVLVVGIQVVRASRPIFRHVEYAGLIPHLETLASTFGDDDLVIFESRGASDSHVLAMPLAYVYARHVLVFARTDPPKEVFRDFFYWALKRYRHVFFVGGGGGGTELLSRSMTVRAVRGEGFQIPEYESAVNAYPAGVHRKEFDLSVYEFLPKPAESDVITIDVGSTDDLYVRRMYAKEQNPAGFTLRWTRNESYISLVGVQPHHHLLTMWMGAGGRAPNAEPATVEAFLDDRSLGRVTVGEGIRRYEFRIPQEVAAALSRQDSAATLRLTTTTWNPQRLTGNGDPRDLGVMLDRLEVR